MKTTIHWIPIFHISVIFHFSDLRHILPPKKVNEIFTSYINTPQLRVECLPRTYHENLFWTKIRWNIENGQYLKMTSIGFRFFLSIQFVTWCTQYPYQADRALCGRFVGMMFTRKIQWVFRKKIHFFELGVLFYHQSSENFQSWFSLKNRFRVIDPREEEAKNYNTKSAPPFIFRVMRSWLHPNTDGSEIS